MNSEPPPLPPRDTPRARSKSVDKTGQNELLKANNRLSKFKIREKFSRERKAGKGEQHREKSTPLRTKTKMYPEFRAESYEQRGKISANYKSVHKWELDGKIGETVIIMATVFPGWYFCYNEVTRSMGIFPAENLQVTEEEKYTAAPHSECPSVISPPSNYDSSRYPLTVDEDQSHYAPATSSEYPSITSLSSDCSSPKYPFTPDADRLRFASPRPVKTTRDLPPLHRSTLVPSTVVIREHPKVSALWLLVDTKYETEDIDCISAEKGELLRWQDFSEEYLEDPTKVLKEEWLYCVNMNEERGYFPSAYGHIIFGRDELVFRLKDLPHAVAKASYVPSDEGEMTLEVGDVVYLTTKKDQFYSGFKCDGSSGYIPADILDIIHPLPILYSA
ncbi:hypothetical protein Aperf_G00000023267 [Anoplocephala perfoliata]